MNYVCSKLYVSNSDSSKSVSITKKKTYNNNQKARNVMNKAKRETE